MKLVVVAAMDNVDKSDREGAHGECTTLLLDYLRSIGHGEVSAKFEEIEQTVGFWDA